MPGGGGKKGRKPTTSANRNLSRADFVYQRLRNGIRSGDFRPGDRMREAVLAAKLKVSRTPIREAIRRLASEGFLEVAASRGVMIVELNKQQVREVYALREALEGTAARFAAQHASASEIAEMRELLEHSAGKDTTPEASAKFNRLFHSALHDAAHNRYLAQALQQLYDTLALLPGTTFAAPGRAETAHAEHLALLTAIEKRNADKADQLARDHIRAAGQIRMRMMFETPSD